MVNSPLLIIPMYPGPSLYQDGGVVEVILAVKETRETTYYQVYTMHYFVTLML